VPRWLDAGTRALIIKATFYNGNLDNYVTGTFVFEVTRGGEVVASATWGTLKTTRIDFEKAPFAGVCEIVVYGFTIFNTCNQLYIFYATTRKTGSVLAYFKDIWNVIELIVLVVFFTAVSARVSLLLSLYPDPMIFETVFIDYYSISLQYAMSFNLESVCVLAIFAKMFKYAQLSPQTSLLWLVLTRSGLDIFFFIGMLLTLIFAFGMMAVQIMGPSLEDYNSIMNSILYLILIILGQFDLPAMIQASEMLGFTFFILYIMVMFFILMNIFLAILGEAYSVERELQQEELDRKPKTRAKRSWRTYLKLIWVLFKSKLKRRRQHRQQQKEKR